MSTKYNPKSIQEILASKEVEVPKPQFTKAEWAVMTREYKNFIDEHQKRAVADFTTNVLKPWLEAIDQARSLRETGKADLVAQVTEAVRERTASNLILRGEISPQLAALPPRGLPGGCIGTWALEPPYDRRGEPRPVGQEETTDTIAPGGGPGIFKATSVLTKPEEGILSVGIGVGRFFDDLYPAPLQDRFGDGNEVSANICHFMVFPGSLANRTRVDVAVHVTIDSPFAHTYHTPTNGRPGTGIEDGPVWVLGNMYLTLFGDPAVGELQPTTIKRFVVQMWTGTLGCFYCDYENEFDLSESLVLDVGAAGLGINVEVRLRTFLTGRLEDLASGFMGADFRLPSPETHGIWLLETGGGPIRIPTMSVTFCGI